jgi:hypothetical protein
VAIDFDSESWDFRTDTICVYKKKVKVVRETMNRTLELWKEVPGISEEISVPSQSTCSSIGISFFFFLSS